MVEQQASKNEAMRSNFNHKKIKIINGLVFVYNLSLNTLRIF
jgi:hypothetical protein